MHVKEVSPTRLWVIRALDFERPVELYGVFSVQIDMHSRMLHSKWSKTILYFTASILEYDNQDQIRWIYNHSVYLVTINFIKLQSLGKRVLFLISSSPIVAATGFCTNVLLWYTQSKLYSKFLGIISIFVCTQNPFDIGISVPTITLLDQPSWMKTYPIISRSIYVSCYTSYVLVIFGRKCCNVDNLFSMAYHIC